MITRPPAHVPLAPFAITRPRERKTHRQIAAVRSATRAEVRDLVLEHRRTNPHEPLKAQQVRDRLPHLSLPVIRAYMGELRSGLAMLRCRRVAVKGCDNTRLAKVHAHSADAAMGIAWFNSLTKQQRLEALRTADTDMPAEAWAFYKATGAFKCEENSHA